MGKTAVFIHHAAVISFLPLKSTVLYEAVSRVPGVSVAVILGAKADTTHIRVYHCVSKSTSSKSGIRTLSRETPGARTMVLT